MNDKNEHLENLLKDPGLTPPSNFTMQLMFKVGQTEQLPEPEPGLRLVVGFESGATKPADFFAPIGNSIKQTIAVNPLVQTAAQFCKWLALAAGGVLGVQQSLAFVVGAWTASAAI